MSHFGRGGRRVVATLLLLLLVLVMTIPSISAVSVGRSVLLAGVVSFELVVAFLVESHLTLIMAKELRVVLLSGPFKTEQTPLTD